MGDVDLLVDPDDFQKAHDAIVGLGFKLDDRSPFQYVALSDAKKFGGAEYVISCEDGSDFWLELQWRPVAGRWIQSSQEPSAKDLVNLSKRLGQLLPHFVQLIICCKLRYIQQSIRTFVRRFDFILMHRVVSHLI